MSTTTQDPIAALAQLEQDAYDGKSVTPDQLASARAAVDAAARLTELAEQGNHDRASSDAAAKADGDRAAARERGKATLADAVTGVRVARDQLLAALDNLAEEASTVNEALDSIGTDYLTAGVTSSRKGHARIAGAEVIVTDAGAVQSVVVDGVEHGIQPPRAYILAVVGQWLRDHHIGLTTQQHAAIVPPTPTTLR
jgi:hypothetical protein